MENYNGKVALVTGGSRGIGRAIAVQLSRMGIHVAINFVHNDNEAEKSKKLVTDNNVNCITVRADVSKGNDVVDMIRKIEDKLGMISILVNNAGISKQIPFRNLTEKDWDETIDINLKSVFLVTQAVIPKMIKEKWGRIINISSTASQIGGIVGPHYTASKAGIIGLTHSYASLLVSEGITVNAIAPALIETDMLKSDLKTKADIIPMKRFGQPEEVSDIVELLVKNGYMTGQTINTNGGMYMSS